MSVNKSQTEVNAIELYTEWFLQQLKESGYIKEYLREAYSLQVMPEKKLERYNVKKTKFDIEKYTLFNADFYTFDYMIVWDISAQDIFYNLLDGTPIKTKTPFYAFLNKEGSHVSLCDVKPAAQAAVFARFKSADTFPIKQKALFAFLGIYINKTIPIPMVSKGKVKSGNAQALFTSCFCPIRYTFTDGGGQPRLIHFKTRTMEQYVAEKRSELEHINGLLSVKKLL